MGRRKSTPEQKRLAACARAAKWRKENPDRWKEILTKARKAWRGRMSLEERRELDRYHQAKHREKFRKKWNEYNRKAQAAWRKKKIKELGLDGYSQLRKSYGKKKK
jgi:hypothetical protein